MYYDDKVLNTIGITHESLSIRLGRPLDNLYCPVTDVIYPVEYQRYTSPVPATYTEKIYRTDGTGKVYTISTTGQVQFEVLHYVGDPILDQQGNQILLHNTGDVILDVAGNPIPSVGYTNSLGHGVGLTVYDARYYYAEDESVIAYAADIPLTIYGYLQSEIKYFQGLLYEQTKLLYKPKGEPAYLSVLTNENKRVTVTSTLYPKIVFYMSPVNYNNASLLSKIKTITRGIISNQITRKTITLANLITDINDAIDNDKITTFGVIEFLPNKLIMATVNTGYFNIGEKLTLTSDGKYTVTDVVDITFKKITE
jgi:hypothetical protein